MKVGLWKHTLLAGALSVITLWPVATYAAPAESLGPAGGAGDALHQFFGGGGFLGGGLQTCLALGSGGLTGSAVGFGGVNQLAGLGSGAWYGPYYAPAYGSLGIGAYGGFLNYIGGQPSQFATLAGSPYCAGVGIPVGTGVGGAPCVVNGYSFGTGGIGFGSLPFGGVSFTPFSTSPFGTGVGATGGVICR